MFLYKNSEKYAVDVYLIVIYSFKVAVLYMFVLLCKRERREKGLENQTRIRSQSSNLEDLLSCLWEMQSTLIPLLNQQSQDKALPDN